MPKGVRVYNKVMTPQATSARVCMQYLECHRGNRPYQFSILEDYINGKFRRGKTEAYAEKKLSELEFFASQLDAIPFVRVREFFGFRQSPRFGHLQPEPLPAIEVDEVPPPAYHNIVTGKTEPATVEPILATGGASSSSTVPLSPLSPSLAAPEVPLSRSANASPAPILVNGEHALEMLRDFDTAFIVDDSQSMTGSRWEQARVAIKGVVGQACKYDDDGVDIYFLNARRDRTGVRKPKDVDKVFQGVSPRGTTPTGRTIERILRDYMRELESATAAGEPDKVKPLNLIIITDGAPTDDPESVIINYAKRLDKGDYPLSQVGIQFFQVGNDPEATQALNELDDELGEAHGIRDMVDTVPYQGDITPELIVKVLLGGINRRLDRKAAAA